MHPSMVLFIVIYGLDWVATVPPTVALCREAFGERGTIVFGWVFAAHQIGAAVAALGAGVVRDKLRLLHLRVVGGCRALRDRCGALGADRDPGLRGGAGDPARCRAPLAAGTS
ncbi:hypothetical protein [Nocardioides convexus]|uniref:hypothetical protein n=1 Tax=Nocardioides convexus TaxID=2712224 RepID=UPI002418A2F3|nr:hypothetical protein [Nocardioides convexus]